MWAFELDLKKTWSSLLKTEKKKNFDFIRPNQI